MFLGLLMFMISWYFFLIGSFHVLIFLLFLEILIIGCFFYFIFLSFSWFYCLMFLLVSVCLGAYGISILVSNSRSKGFVYFFSF